MTKNLFVSGMFRSGTTNFAKFINTNDKISFSSDPYFHYFKIARSIFYREKGLKFDYKAPIDDNFTTSIKKKTFFFKNFDNLIFKKNDIRRFINETIPYIKKPCPEIEKQFLNLKVKKYTSKTLISKLLDIIEQTYNKEDIEYRGFKSVWLDEYIELLLKKNFKVIHIIRDPRGIVSSCFNNTQYGTNPILFLLRHWRNSVHQHMNNSDNRNYLLIRFEDFILENKKTVKKIETFLNIKSRFSKKKLFEERGWIQNSSFKNKKKGLNANTVQYWKNSLNKDEIKFIEYFCEAEMRFMGYKFITKNLNFDNICIKNIRENKNQFSKWILPYCKNYLLNHKQIKKELERKNHLFISWSKIKKNSFFFFNKSLHSQLKSYVKKKT